MNFVKYPGRTWCEVLPDARSEAVDLIKQLVCFESGRRLGAHEVCHPCIAMLRNLWLTVHRCSIIHVFGCEKASPVKTPGWCDTARVRPSSAWDGQLSSTFYSTNRIVSHTQPTADGWMRRSQGPSGGQVDHGDWIIGFEPLSIYFSFVEHQTYA